MVINVFYGVFCIQNLAGVQMDPMVPLMVLFFKTTQSVVRNDVRYTYKP